MPASAGGKFLVNGETVIDIRQHGLASIRFDILQLDTKSLFSSTTFDINALNFL